MEIQSAVLNLYVQLNLFVNFLETYYKDYIKYSKKGGVHYRE